ncbi:hypothetical protein Tco_1399053, partial [Tanacetum coccineum]
YNSIDVFIVNIYDDGVFVPNPLKYMQGSFKVINDIQFKEMQIGDLFEVVKRFLNGFMVDLFIEWNDYDVTEYVRNDRLVYDNEPENDGEELYISDEDHDNIEFHTKGEQNVVLEPLTIDDPFLNKLVGKETKYKVRDGVKYLTYNLETSWKEFQPVLGIDSNSLLAYYGRDLDLGSCKGKRDRVKKSKVKDNDKGKGKMPVSNSPRESSRH